MKWFTVTAAAYLLACPGARGGSILPYLDTHLTAEQRATDLVGRMTLAEKASQMGFP